MALEAGVGPARLPDAGGDERQMIVLWVVLLLGGVAAAAVSSKRAVNAALETAEALGVSAGLVGVTILAVGTDLPEIANSIIASLSDHGDINVGDSTGSALTQVTLVLAILILAGGLTADLRSANAQVALPVGALSVVALLALAVMLSDGVFSRLNGITLVAAWGVSVIVLERRTRVGESAPRIPGGRAGREVLRTLGWLVVVGIAATAIVRSFIEITDAVGAPEFIASTIVLALGTSVPELVVDWTAIRRGAAALAIGDIFGATLADSTLSVGMGPIFRATAVSPETTTGVIIIAIGIAAATAIVVTTRRRTAMVIGLLVTYAGAMTTLVLLAS